MTLWKRIGGWAVQNVGQAAIGYVGRRGSAVLTRRATTRQAFTIVLPSTVYIYGTRCRVTIIPCPGDQVILDSEVAGALQPSLTVEQDADGIYIIAKPKRIANALTQIEFTLTMPPDVRVVAQLTAGEVILSDLSGTLEIPPRR